VTAPVLGSVVPGAGTVISPGPTAGTWWAVPEPGAVAGTVVDDTGRVVAVVTAGEQATRLARADAILARGALHVPGPDGGPGLVHLPCCPDIPMQWPHGTTGLYRNDAARDALHGQPVVVPPAVGWRQVPAGWCPTCLPDTAHEGTTEP
jgi:hypothetical protein